jgi:glyoxylase-like metal-dependent hydrolase (beta-lactamase superfamily II)
VTQPNIVPGVHRMGTELVNWYLVEEDGRLTAVDAGLPAFRKSLEQDMPALGQRLAAIAAVVLTHSDADHTGLVPELRGSGARVLIHTDDEAKIRRPGPKEGEASPLHIVPLMWRPAFWRFMGGMARRGGGKGPRIEGAETFTGGDVLDVPGRPRAVHTPGHTRGHSALLFEGHGALFVGDELCTWNPLTGSRVPQLMPRQFNVSNAACAESLALLEGLEADVLLPGHGDPWREGPPAAVASARGMLGSRS